MALTLVVPCDRLSLQNVDKNIRNEVHRGQREKLVFKQISLQEHLPHLRKYRKRRGLLMLPFPKEDPRTYFGAFNSSGKYLCSTALYLWNGALRIQAVSIDKNAPYYAYSWLIYSCLQKACREGFRGLDLSSEGVWKRRWHPVEEDDGSPQARRKFGGPVSMLVTKIYWFTEKRPDAVSKKIHAWMVKRWG